MFMRPYRGKNMAKSSINIKPCKVKISEAHNERKVKLDYIMPGREGRFICWKERSISEKLEEVKDLYEKKIGRGLSITARPIREAVVNIKPDTQVHDLRTLGDALRRRFGIDLFQIHIHHDEGHIADHEDSAKAQASGDNTVIPGMPMINHHAHLLFGWQEKTTGRSIKLKRDDLREMQTMTAEILGMERGETNSRAIRLEAKEYKTFAQQLAKDIAQAKQVAITEISKIDQEVDQKKKILNEARQEYSFENVKSKLETTGIELLKSEKDLKQMENQLKSKSTLSYRLETLSWNNCNTNDVQAWLSISNGLNGIKIEKGKDGSIWFQLGGEKARLKDLSVDVKEIIKVKLSANKILQREHQNRSGIKF
jgi:hypothetical protein